MHPQIAKTMVEQHCQDLMTSRGHSRRGLGEPGGSHRLVRRLPRWHVSWSRTVLSPAGTPGLPDSSGRPDRPGQRGSSLVIIISAYRSA
jgi:hypothetical protein